ncbi:MAG: hypothetical protein J6S14_02355 [Clostridia bacterium]|nr:hypothetical protein [Clostridia bacterium]
MPTDIYETEVTMPRWELRDPLGRGAVRKARWEYTQMKRERDALRNELEAVYKERGKAVNMMIDALNHEQGVTAELTRRLAVCDEARKSLGEKLNNLQRDNDDLLKRLAREMEDCDTLSRTLARLQEENEQLRGTAEEVRPDESS